MAAVMQVGKWIDTTFIIHSVLPLLGYIVSLIHFLIGKCELSYTKIVKDSFAVKGNSSYTN